MKYFKIELGRDENGLVYPANYQEEIGDKAVTGDAHVYYDDDDGNKFLLLAIRDVDSIGVAKDGVVEVSAVDAEQLSVDHEKVRTVFSDEAEVERIKIKVLRGQVLTTDEEKALDPTDDTITGFSKSKRLMDRIAANIAAELSP